MDTREIRPYSLPVRYFADNARHLVCEPFSREGLLEMADDLDIPRAWYHPGRLPHIDIPKRQVDRILSDPRVTVVTPRDVLAIITGAVEATRRH